MPQSSVAGSSPKAGVGVGELIGAADHRQPEPLRGLAAGQAVPAGNGGHQPVADDGDRVGRGDGHPHRPVIGQRRHAVGDGLLADQRPGGVVEQDVALVVAQLGDRAPGGPGPGGPAVDDVAELGVATGPEQGSHLLGMARGHDHQDPVHRGRLLEGGDGMLDHRPARQRQQLLGDRRAEPLARAAREHHRHRPHDADSTGGARVAAAPGLVTPARGAYLGWLLRWPGPRAVRPGRACRGGGSW